VILNEAEIADEQVRPAVYQQVSKERLMLALAECEELAQPSDFRAFVYSARSFGHLRAFMPKFLDSMRFRPAQESDPVLEAVTYMRQFNAENRRKMVDAPTDFVPWHWKRYVVNDSGEVASRAMYELCLADCLVQALDNGRLWVEHSREHTSFREDWTLAPHAVQVSAMSSGQLSNELFWLNTPVWPIARCLSSKCARCWMNVWQS
jgi:hypothetical protein